MSLTTYPLTAEEEEEEEEEEFCIWKNRSTSTRFEPANINYRGKHETKKIKNDY